MPQIVIDTNVLYAGLRSQRGYSFRLLQLVGTGKFDINLSVPLLLEYEDVMYRDLSKLQVSPPAIEAVLNYHCAVANHHKIFFLWRPFLRDPKDDLVLELAVAARCDYIVTFNQRDFQGVEKFALQAVSPKEFLSLFGEVV